VPVFTVVLYDSTASTGWYFFHSIKLSGSQALNPTSIILDARGNIVYFKRFSRAVTDFKLQPNGKMTYTQGGQGLPVKGYILDSTFTLRDSVACVNGIPTDPHDLQILSSGHYLLIGLEIVIMDLSSYYWFNGNGSPGSPNANVKCGVIQELDENKNLVWQWRAVDHFAFADVQEEWLFDPVNVDWTHWNSIGLDSDGNILISSRHFSEVTKINRQTGAVIWRLGGKNNEFTFVNDPYSGFHGQHDARRIANGNITVFDNGKLGSPVHPARGAEYFINENNQTASLIWNYFHSINSMSRFMGSTQRLNTGNTLIDWGGLREANMLLSLVKPNGSRVLELNFPDTSMSYRSFNYSSLPWRLNRPVITCYAANGNHYLDAGGGYTSYLWSTGATTQSIQILQTGTYYVFVNYGPGGYISSEKVSINNLSNPCEGFIGINPVSTEIPSEFKLYQNYPNPFNGKTVIRFQLPVVRNYGQRTTNNVQLLVYDVLGRHVETIHESSLQPGTYEALWDASRYPSGVYFYNLTSGHYTESKKMLLIK
jgi:hypothetical protein